MIRFEWASSFERAWKNWIAKHPTDRDVIKQKLEQFTANPFDPEPKNHKLVGQLKGLRDICFVLIRIISRFSIQIERLVRTQWGNGNWSLAPV